MFTQVDGSLQRYQKYIALGASAGVMLNGRICRFLQIVVNIVRQLGKHLCTVIFMTIIWMKMILGGHDQNNLLNFPLKKYGRDAALLLHWPASGP